MHCIPFGLSRPLIALFLCLLVSCSGGGGGDLSDPVCDTSGSWVYESDSQQHGAGYGSAQLSQAGNSISGTYYDAVWGDTYQLSGTISGHDISMTGTDGDELLSFSGAINPDNHDQMRGSYTSSQGDNGTWQAMRTDGGSGGGTASVTLENNNASAVVAHWYFSPSSSSYWGDDHLAGRSLEPGESFTISGLSADDYDSKVVNSNGSSRYLWSVTIGSGEERTLYIGTEAWSAVDAEALNAARAPAGDG